jgi:nucleoid-associated protein YgaU
MIVSFSVNGNVSASSNVPLDASMAVGYEDNVATSSISDTDYQVNESVTLSKNNFQEANQIFQSTPKKYVVKHGDTVYRIAVNMLGDGSRWIEIAQLNKLEQLSNGSILIHPGQELIIPD